MINNDAVVRTNYHKYFHPKEVLISNGVLNRAISEAAGKSGAKNMGYSDETVNAQALSFVYPYGATLNVAKPAVSVLSTGSVSFPLNRPVCAFYTHPGKGPYFDYVSMFLSIFDQLTTLVSIFTTVPGNSYSTVVSI